jgi:uncharacterized membrane protein YbhN (UPF0104 family)
LALKLNKVLFVVLKLSISSALLYYVLSRTGISQVAGTLRNITPVSFLSAVFLYIFAQFISTLRWQLFLPEGLSLKKLFSLYMIGSFFNTFLPGVIGGDAVKAYYLYKETGKADMSFASVFMDRYLGFVVLILISTIAFPFGHQYFHGSRIEWLLPFTVLSFFTASFLIFGLRLGQRVRFLSEFYNYFHTYRNRKHLISKGLMLSAVVQLSGIAAVSILADGLGQHIPFLAFLMFIPLIVLFAMLPISISGLGVREGAFVLFFGLIGVKPEIATAISLSWFITISTAGIWGLIYYIRYKKEMVDI